MLPTFVIGLREGLEAALIVGIIAAFLRKQGRTDLVRWVFAGVAVAVLLCVGVGVALKILSNNLPQQQQEGLETVVGALAVVMVTYMVVWMRRHSRELKSQLESMAAEAVQSSSRGALAMVFMAFLAVLREGFETVVFLLAVFNEPHISASAGWGALAGILVAVGLGYGIYRGGVRLNLSKFFRATGLVLVLVAAGLVVTALHTAHEAGWLNAGQGATVDLTGLVRPGSVQSSLLTGMLGVQPHPVVIEVIGWLVYLIPVGLYVAWPPGRGPSRQLQLRAVLGVAALAGVGALVLALVAPGRPVRPGATDGARLVSHDAGRAVVQTALVSPAAQHPRGSVRHVAMRVVGPGERDGLPALVYRTTVTGTGAAGRPGRLDIARIAALNGGRLPLGTDQGATSAAVHYADADQLTVWVEPRTGRVLDASWTERVTATISAKIGALPLDRPVATARSSTPPGAVDDAVHAARADLDRIDRHNSVVTLAWCALALAVLALGAAGMVLRAGRRQAAAAPAPVQTPSSALARS